MLNSTPCEVYYMCSFEHALVTKCIFRCGTVMIYGLASSDTYTSQPLHFLCLRTPKL